MAKDFDAVGMIYFIASEGQCAAKIGFSADVRARLSDLQKGNPHRLTIIGQLRATRAAEEALHLAIKEFRIGGEWYPDDGFALGVLEGLGEYAAAAAIGGWDGGDLDGFDRALDGHVLSAGDIEAAMPTILEEHRLFVADGRQD